jgi:hypothetical protein
LFAGGVFVILNRPVHRPALVLDVPRIHGFAVKQRNGRPELVRRVRVVLAPLGRADAREFHGAIGKLHASGQLVTLGAQVVFGARTAPAAVRLEDQFAVLDLDHRELQWVAAAIEEHA